MKYSKAMFAGLFSAVLAVGCSSEKNKISDESETGSGVVSVGAQEGAASESAPASPQPSDLPNGFVIPFEHHIVRDRVVTLDDGRRQRRIQAELFGGSIRDQMEQMDAALQSAGYKAGRANERGQEISTNYRKDGQVQLVVTFVDSPPEKGDREDATGILRIGWNQ